MWERWKQLFVNSRGGRAITKLDVVGVGLMSVGVVWGVAGLLSGGSPGGFGFFAIGFLILFRHHPGGP